MLDSVFDGLSTFGYDNRDQVVTADRPGTTQDEGFAFDAAGNRTSAIYGGTTANATFGTEFDQNRLASDGVYSYTFDAQGNTATRTKIGEHIAYSWDHRNRLVRVEYPRSLK